MGNTPGMTNQTFAENFGAVVGGLEGGAAGLALGEAALTAAMATAMTTTAEASLAEALALIAAEGLLPLLLGGPVGGIIAAGLFLGLMAAGFGWLGQNAGMLAGSWLGDLFGFGRRARDPIIIDLDGNGVQLTDVRQSTTYFDFAGDGFAERTGWVSPGDGLLVFDQNNNGSVDGADELVGAAASNGFDALLAFDSNGDGKIASDDASYTSFRVWRDANQDGISQASELLTLQDAGVSSINIATQTASPQVQRSGNLIFQTGAFTKADGTTGEAISTLFTTDAINSRYIPPEGFQYDPEVFSLPNLRGYGNVPDLWVAMTLDPELKKMVKDLVAGAPSLTDFGSVLGHWHESMDIATWPVYDTGAFDKMLYRWSQVIPESFPGTDSAASIFSGVIGHLYLDVIDKQIKT